MLHPMHLHPFPSALVRGLRWLLPCLGFAALGLAADANSTFTFKRGVNISHWLSQNNETRPYAADWFTDEDVNWIAAQGFDHIRYPIDGRLWLRPDGSLDDEKIAPFVQALEWTREQGLGAILDMHFLPGASFDPGAEDRAAFTDETIQAGVVEFWRAVARRFASEGDYLRFEVLNEPIAADNRQLNPFNRRILEAVRESNPTRIVYLTSNMYGSFKTVSDLELPDDPNIALTLHYYEPMIFTHQRASWTRLPDDMPLVPFPGRVPDLTGSVPPDHFTGNVSGRELTVAAIDADFETVARWAAQHLKGRELHIGEFGAYDRAPADSRQRYVSAVARAAERHGWGWAIWDYQGGFAVRNRDGEPTEILRGLLPR